jgi:hypothetical protein
MSSETNTFKTSEQAADEAWEQAQHSVIDDEIEKLKNLVGAGTVITLTNASGVSVTY